jgi:hypothetical protein
MNSILNRANNRLNSVLTNTAPVAASTSTGGSLPYVFAGIILVLALVVIFYKHIMFGFNLLYDSVRGLFVSDNKAQLMEPEDSTTVTQAPEAPQDIVPDRSSLTEKILPGRSEVFNVSQNRFTYYDAEPLCKALGAELATYDQVKEAWDKGADWCNYGWVKGQVAAYPTQNATWEKLQQGPEDQRGACGRAGVNGGFFDNPELRFGVNCYGTKPAQSQHDENTVSQRNNEPMTPGMLDYDKKVAHFRSEADHIGITPFNKSTWGSL